MRWTVRSRLSGRRRTAVTWATKKRAEWRAMAGIEAILGEILAERAGAPPTDDFLDQIYAAYGDLPEEDRVRQTARDVMVIHMGSQSNLYAALAWTMVNLLQHPDLLHRVRQGDDVLLEQCANESIRMAQRSITMRQVLQPIEVDTGAGIFRLAPGTMLTTMLSATNTSVAPGLDVFDPGALRRSQAGHRGGGPDQGAGQHLRPWPALVPGRSLLHLGHPGVDPSAARALRAQPGVPGGQAPSPADRWCGPSSQTMLGQLRAARPPLNRDAQRKGEWRTGYGIAPVHTRGRLAQLVRAQPSHG